jgi:hypothetical protein
MLKQTCENIDQMAVQKSRKNSVWRDGVVALMASLGVGLLAASILTIIVFALSTTVG